MKITIVVDANVILSALLGGSARFILFKSEFSFVTTRHTLGEVKKYAAMVAKKSDVSKKEIIHALTLLPIKIYDQDFYKNKLRQANKLIGSVDPKDADILALTIQLDTYLWTADKHFNKVQNKIKLLSTDSLL